MNCSCSSAGLANCHSCGSTNLVDVVCLGDQPLANGFTDDAESARAAPRFPLHLVACGCCTLVQVTDTVDPEHLFGDYAYFTSASSPMVAHADALAEQLVGDRELGRDDLVIEPASNDGYLLSAYIKRGVPAIGIEPAWNVALAAMRRGVPTLVEFFGVGTATAIAQVLQPASVVHAHNVLAHVPDVNDFVAGLAAAVSDDGIVVVETPWVVDLLRARAFDTIYHEHVFYWSLDALSTLFARHGLHINGIDHLEVHGGSLRVRASRHPQSDVGAVRMIEARQVEDTVLADELALLPGKIARTIERLRSAMVDAMPIAGYGAPAKATMLMNVAGFRVDFCTDTTPAKQGRFVPGVGVPIREPEALYEVPNAVLFAWNFEDSVVALERTWLETGGRFLVPFPTPRWIGVDG